MLFSQLLKKIPEPSDDRIIAPDSVLGLADIEDIEDNNGNDNQANGQDEQRRQELHGGEQKLL